MSKIEKCYPKNSEIIDEPEPRCMVCNEINLSITQYYKCTHFHNFCETCYKKNSAVTVNYERSKKCPFCSSNLKNEFKQPDDLTPSELFKINVKELSLNKIYIHQNFTLQYDTEQIKICLNKTETNFYACDGKIAMYLDMFVGENGFLYTYNKLHKVYHLAVNRNKYQFWDVRKLVLQM